MSSQESAEIKVQVNSIGAVYKQYISGFMKPDHPPKMPEIEPEYVHLNFMPLVSEISHNGASAIIRKDDVRRLNLMVGDVVTLKITKS